MSREALHLGRVRRVDEAGVFDGSFGIWALFCAVRYETGTR
jgi:hypothetical protein